jgi:hypothetical protein
MPTDNITQNGYPEVKGKEICGSESPGIQVTTNTPTNLDTEADHFTATIEIRPGIVSRRLYVEVRNTERYPPQVRRVGNKEVCRNSRPVKPPEASD